LGVFGGAKTPKHQLKKQASQNKEAKVSDDRPAIKGDRNPKKQSLGFALTLSLREHASPMAGYAG
jgi:hypothetical protein